MIKFSYTLSKVIKDFNDVEFYHNKIHTAVVSEGHFYCTCSKCKEKRKVITNILENYSITIDFTKKDCFTYDSVNYCCILDLVDTILIDF